ncbi:hypothetical protein MMC22_008477 [Lobaria immixta]|nr:hypothetical protein [Lobaria immixta]
MNLEESPHDLSASSTNTTPSGSSEDHSKETKDKPASSDGQEAHALKKKIEGLDKEMAIKRKEIEELCAWLAADAKRRSILIQFIETFWCERGIPMPDTIRTELKRQKARYVALVGMIKPRN